MNEQRRRLIYGKDRGSYTKEDWKVWRAVYTLSFNRLRSVSGASLESCAENAAVDGDAAVLGFQQAKESVLMSHVYNMGKKEE